MKKLEVGFVEDIVKEVTEDFKKRSEDRLPLELQWRLNMNFLMGNQNCEITDTGNVVDFGKQYFWQQREVYNQIAPIIETRLSKLGRVKANVNVRPLTTDDSDINSAKFASKLLLSINQENKIDEIIGDGNHWSEVCGSVFYKISWNNDKGKQIGMLKNKPIFEGDVEIYPCPPFEIYPDNIATNNLDGCESVIHAKAYPIEKIKYIWGEDITPDRVDVFSLNSQNSSGGLGYGGSVSKVIFKNKENYAVVIEKYEKPSTGFPNGRLIIVAGDKLLHYGDLPYANSAEGRRGFPFVRQVAIENAGCLFGTSVIERVIPIQRAYNILRNRKHELLNKITMGVLAVEDGSIDTSDLEDEGLSPGKILVYRQGSNPPHMLSVSKIPSDFIYEEEKLINEFTMISGVGEFAKYIQTPANITSGIALSLIMEQDDIRMSISANEIKNAIRNIGQQTLRLYKQLAVGRRMKRIAGDNGKIEYKSFCANDISNDDLIFDTDNELNDTPASRRNMVVDLVKMGVFTEENGRMSSRTRLKLLDVLGLGNWEASRDIEELHQKHAINENELFAKGVVEVEEIDDHNLHITEHTKYLISGEFKVVGNERLRVIEHIKQHKRFISMEKEILNLEKEKQV